MSSFAKVYFYFSKSFMISFIEFKLGDVAIEVVDVDYDWKPGFCERCNAVGHTAYSTF